MEIKEFEWHDFVVPIPREEGETRTEYLFKCLNHLKQFHRSYSEFPRSNASWTRWAADVEKNLEGILGVHMFSDMLLRGGFCNVKYKVIADDSEGLPTGIHVYSHVLEELVPVVDLLRARWKEFGYQEHLIELPVPEQRVIYPD